MTKKLIAISGWKRSGKDTAGDYLRNKCYFNKLSFAEPLKELCANQFGLTYADLYDQDYKELPLRDFPVIRTDNASRVIQDLFEGELRESSKGTVCWTPRALMILIGSTMRAVDPNFWVNQAVKLYENQKNCCVLTDLRYTNEANTLKARLRDEVVLVRINRFETNPSTDPSETDLDNYPFFDYVIDNKGTLEELYSKLDSIVKGECYAN